MHLFSPQSYFIQEGKSSFHLTRDETVFTFSLGKHLIFSYTKGSRLPTAYGEVEKKNDPLTGYLSLSTSGRLNISKSQEELLLWHSILGHYDIKNIQELIWNGVLARKQPDTGTCMVLLCRSCVAGKGKRVSYKITHHSPNQKHTDVLKKGDLQPGDQVRTDQYERRIKGRLPYIKRKEDPHKIMSGGTIFVDHTSVFVKIYNQVSLGPADAVRSK